MHVYHYSSAEPTVVKQLMAQHATREAEVDDLLRRGVFVDLLTVTRQALRAGVRSYSLKQTERLAGFARAAEMGAGSEAVLGYERWCDSQDQAELDAIAAYNEEDCLATVALRNWLLEVRPAGITGPAPIASPVRDEEDAEAATARELLRQELTAGEPQGSEALARRRVARVLPPRGSTRLVAAFRLSRDGRERPHRRRRGARRTDAGGRARGTLRRAATSTTLRFPEQDHKIEPGTWIDPATGKGVNVCSVDDAERLVVIRRAKDRADEPLPRALTPGGPIDTRAQRGALLRLATAVRDRSDRFRALQDVLAQRAAAVLGRDRRRADPDDRPRRGAPAGAHARRERPRRPGAAGHRQDLARGAPDRGPDRERQTRRCHRDEPQGDRQPAGRGRARRGRGACRLQGRAQGRRRSCPSTGALNRVGDPQSACFDPQYDLVAGTSWLFAPELADEQLDYLVIDEAGQLSLADALAAGTAARNLILLGDPLQLPHVSQAVHPEGTSLSVLAHLLGEHPTVPAERGLFLDQTRRMHPDGVHVHLGRGVRGPPEVAPGLRAPERRAARPASATCPSSTGATRRPRRRRSR